jgi:HEPN domain-containing protein
MTKEQYVEYWIDTAKNDWSTSETLFVAGHYLHCLFFAHLTLEKIAKAHWVKIHQDNIPPRMHNIVWILQESQVGISNEDMIFLEVFNQFQLSTRYPDYLRNIEVLCTKEFTENQLNKVKEVRKCLLEMLQ